MVPGAMGQYFPLIWCLAAALHSAEAGNQLGVGSVSCSQSQTTPLGSPVASARQARSEGGSWDKAVWSPVLALQRRAGQESRPSAGWGWRSAASQTEGEQMGRKGRAALGARRQLTVRLCWGPWQGVGWAKCLSRDRGSSCAHGNQGHGCKKGLARGRVDAWQGFPEPRVFKLERGWAGRGRGPSGLRKSFRSLAEGAVPSPHQSCGGSR